MSDSNSLRAFYVQLFDGREFTCLLAPGKVDEDMRNLQSLVYSASDPEDFSDIAVIEPLPSWEPNYSASSFLPAT